MFKYVKVSKIFALLHCILHGDCVDLKQEEKNSQAN